MTMTKPIFIGRVNELEQFQLALGQPGIISRLVFDSPGHKVKSRVFLPSGIEGMGKSELTRRCLQLAENAGWPTLLLEWDRLGYRPAEPLDVANAIADALQTLPGERTIRSYFDERKTIASAQQKARSYHAEHPERWQKPIPPVDNADILTNPDRRLAQSLVKCIVGLVQVRGLVLALDACEILSPALESYLRDQIVCPAIRHANGLIVIVSSRHSQYQRRITESPGGQFQPMAGYADRLIDPPPISWELSTFSYPDIAAYLKAHDLDPLPEIITYLQDATRGVPFAIQLLVSALRELGAENLRHEFVPDLRNSNLPELLRLMVQRFLDRCLSNQADLERIRALALVREWDDAAISALWQLSGAEDPASIIDELQRQYGFIHNHALHEIARCFLRENLRTDARSAAQHLGALAAQHYQSVWKTEADRFSDLAERVTENHWRRLTLGVMNALCWADELTAISFLFNRALESLEFNWEFADGLIRLAQEFRDTEGWWQKSTCDMFDSLSKAISARDTSEFAKLPIRTWENSGLVVEKPAYYMLCMWQADSLTGQNQLSEAVERCNEAEQHLSADESLREGLARRYAIIGGRLGFPNGVAIVSPEAKVAFEKAVALASDNSGYHSALGSLLGLIGDLGEALRQLDQAIELDITNVVAFNNRGLTYNGLTEYAKALADFDQAIELDPRNSAYFYNRGGTYGELRDYAKALADYTKAIELDATDARYFYNRGVTYSYLRDYTNALTDYTKAIELNAMDARYFYARGITYDELGDSENALVDYTKAIELNPMDARYFYNRGVAHANRRDYTKAIPDFSKAIELDPTDARCFYARGNAYDDLKAYTEALADFSQAIQLDPMDPWFYSGQAAIYDKQSDFTHAVKAESQAIELAPHDARLRSNRGLTHYRVGNYAEAVVDFSAAIERNPERARYYSHRGLCFYRLGQHDAAQRDFDHALTLEPDGRAFADLAARWVLTGNFTEAITCLRQAFDQDFEGIRESIADNQDFDTLRNTSEYQALLKELESQPEQHAVE